MVYLELDGEVEALFQSRAIQSFQHGASVNWEPTAVPHHPLSMLQPRMTSTGFKTDPCGTEHVSRAVLDMELPFHTENVLSAR